MPGQTQPADRYQRRLGSVTSPGGADPIANRYQEMDRAFSAVADVCRCNQEWAAVLHFDTPSGDGGPHPHPDRSTSTADRAAGADGVAGSSQLMPPLASAIELAHRYPGCDVVLMVFSDFLLPTQTRRPSSKPSGRSRELSTPACWVASRARPSRVSIARSSQSVVTRRAGDVAQALMTGLTAPLAAAQPPMTTIGRFTAADRRRTPGTPHRFNTVD